MSSIFYSESVSSRFALAEAFEQGAKMRLSDSIRLPPAARIELAAAPKDIQREYVAGWMAASVAMRRATGERP